MFKSLIVLGLIGIGLTAAGVIHYQKNGDQINISIDKSRLKQVSKKLIEEGEELIDGAEQSMSDDRSPVSDAEDRFRDRVEDEVRNQAQRFIPSDRQR